MRLSLLPFFILFLAISALAQSPSPKLGIWERWLGTNPVIEGPNCWNLALVDIGITSHKRFSDPQEFRESLNAFCNPISAQNIQRGDVGAITIDEDYERHAFIVIDKQRAITKDFGSNNPAENISYRIESIKKTIAPYLKSANSPECLAGLDIQEQSPCGARLQYYRCDRTKILLLNQSLRLEWSSLAQALKNSEELLEKYHWNQSTAEEVMNSISKLYQELESISAQNLSTDLEIKQILRLRVLGLSEGILSLPTHTEGARLKENLAKKASLL